MNFENNVFKAYQKTLVEFELERNMGKAKMDVEEGDLGRKKKKKRRRKKTQRKENADSNISEDIVETGKPK